VPRLLVAYHFFHPDDVVSARHFTDLAVEQTQRGWQVTALTSNRACRDPNQKYPPREKWHGIDIVRALRPPLRQDKPLQRLANAAWMGGAWLREASRIGSFDAVIVGSDPAFAATMLIPFRKIWPKARLAHWCFDLYPEAIEAEGISELIEPLVPIARRMMAAAYRRCDLLVDLGPCMRERLSHYQTNARRETLVPWALVEPESPPPPDPEVRRFLFKEARLGLLYSGTLGRAHEFQPFLELARRCRARSGNEIAFAFACRGHRTEELKRALQPNDTNVTLTDFADESRLTAHLCAADLHLISLRYQWSGLVVPSKFFGSMAVGRPVVYAGPADSSIARWIGQHRVGHLCERDQIDEMVKALHGYLTAPESLAAIQRRSFETYRANFSRRAVNDRWDEFLREPGTKSA
jgi:hypothetical protein